MNWSVRRTKHVTSVWIRLTFPCEYRDNTLGVQVFGNTAPIFSSFGEFSGENSQRKYFFKNTLALRFYSENRHDVFAKIAISK